MVIVYFFLTLVGVLAGVWAAWRAGNPWYIPLGWLVGFALALSLRVRAARE